MDVICSHWNAFARNTTALWIDGEASISSKVPTQHLSYLQPNIILSPQQKGNTILCQGAMEPVSWDQDCPWRIPLMIPPRVLIKIIPSVISLSRQAWKDQLVLLALYVMCRSCLLFLTLCSDCLIFIAVTVCYMPVKRSREIYNLMNASRVKTGKAKAGGHLENSKVNWIHCIIQCFQSNLTSLKALQRSDDWYDTLQLLCRQVFREQWL